MTIELLPPRRSRKGTSALAGIARTLSSFLPLALFPGGVVLQRSLQKKKQEGAGRVPGSVGAAGPRGSSPQELRERGMGRRASLSTRTPHLVLLAVTATRAGQMRPGEPSIDRHRTTWFQGCLSSLVWSSGQSAGDSWLTPWREAFRADQNGAGARGSLARVATGPSGLRSSMFI